MTNKQINAAIAKLCGLEVQPQDSFGFKGFNHIPDYCKDLNAMAEAENICINTAALEEEYYHFINRNFRATARQRAEAFLRTLGKWKEAE